MEKALLNIQTVFCELTELACRLGASDAAVIAVSDIYVEDNLASLCREPQCENYGQSTSCPPHVTGPAGFREFQKQYRHAVVFKIDVPTEILLSAQRREIFQLLHQIAADIEQTAEKMGYPQPRAFAGGSCKKLFCRDQPHCRVLADDGVCRNPRLARPSMSGFGINVSELMQTAGWRLNKITKETDPDEIPMGSVIGLVLVD
ncbi:MAG: DUF2284 domain-containing protein [Desulfobacterales bacterium]|nr:DUF2284 domain-containing protein [Desulfobacterales bacterium]